MSDFTGAKCNGCGTVNTTAAAGWFRVLGVYPGAPAVAGVIATPTPRVQAGQPVTTPPTSRTITLGGVIGQGIDICPNCAAGYLPALNWLIGLTTPAKVATPGTATPATAATAGTTGAAAPAAGVKA